MEKLDNNKFSIGGQFWNDNKIFQYESTQTKNKNIVFDGASSAIRFIIEYLKIEKDEYVLLPSYLCPTIIENFNKNKINVVFYNINIDLSIDLDNLAKKVQEINIKAIYIINYFGIYYNKNILTYLEKLKENGIIIIEDSVQALPINLNEEFIGDFVFNSLRKFAAVDGSILINDKDINISYDRFKVNNKYFELIHKARQEKTLFINGIINSEETFLNLFDQAEIEYQKNNEISILPPEDKKKLLTIDYEYIYKKRKENFIYLHENLKNNKDIKIITDIRILEKFIPIGFSILINSRNMIRKELFSKRIFCPVLWDLSNEKFVDNFKESKYISEHILTIPIDQRYCVDDYEEIVKVLKSI